MTLGELTTGTGVSCLGVARLMAQSPPLYRCRARALTVVLAEESRNAKIDQSCKRQPCLAASCHSWPFLVSTVSMNVTPPNFSLVINSFRRRTTREHSWRGGREHGQAGRRTEPEQRVRYGSGPVSRRLSRRRLRCGRRGGLAADQPSRYSAQPPSRSSAVTVR